MMNEIGDREEIAARMRYLEGRHWQDIRKALDIPERSMDRIRARIRKKLKIALEIMALIDRHRNDKKKKILQ